MALVKIVPSSLKICFSAGILLFSGVVKAQDTIVNSADSTKADKVIATKDTAKNVNGSSSDSLRSNIYANIFASMPNGDFQSTDNTNADAGYAKTGFSANLGYSLRIFKGLGIALDLGYTKNYIDEQKLADQIKQITMDQTSFTNINSSATPAFWEIYTVCGGLNYQLWFGSKKKFGVEPIVLLGESHVYTPNVIYNVRIDDLTFETRNLRKGSWQFMHKEGLNINYLMGSRTILHLGGQYYSVSGSGKDMEHIILGNNTYTRTLEEYNININAIYLGIGVTTRF
jgi:hypothetical protein